MEQKSASLSDAANSREYALMVAKTLIFTIEDINILGIKDAHNGLEGCLYDIMKKFNIKKQEIRVRELTAIN